MVLMLLWKVLRRLLITLLVYCFIIIVVIYVDVGFEMLIFSFGSAFSYENVNDPEYVARMKNLTDYALSKGIEVGGYDLIVWTRDPGGMFSTYCIVMLIIRGLSSY